jgi:hypothetical protein
MRNYVEKAMPYAEYIKLIDDLLEQGKTTGENQSEAMFNYGKLNRQRMKRLAVSVELNESLSEKAQNVGQKWIWLIITEGWCGDAAQNIPIIEKIAHLNSNIETRYVLRDENLELMDKYLTNNARSIPKLICLDAETLEEIGTWGPRPQEAMNYFYEMRDGGELDKPQMMENMQRWYLKNKEQAIQAEFEKLLESWTTKENAAAH